MSESNIVSVKKLNEYDEQDGRRKCDVKMCGVKTPTPKICE